MIVQLHFSEEYLSAHRTQIESGNYEIPRDCTLCEAESSVIGHGLRERTCIGLHTNLIYVRRGLCKACRTTFTFLPAFARPYSRYAVEVVQHTFLNFVSNDERLLLRSLPDLPSADNWPDMKTLNNWLHAVIERIAESKFEFGMGKTLGRAGFPMLPKEKFLSKVSKPAIALYESLYNGLAALKEKFDTGARMFAHGLDFHAWNFFRALFPAGFGVIIAWPQLPLKTAHHLLHDFASEPRKIT